MFKKDNFSFGLALGILAPFLGLVILYFLKFPSVSFGDFLRYFFREKALITSLGSLSLLANVALFTLYINSKKDKTAKGIFFSTLVYGISILLIKLFI